MTKAKAKTTRTQQRNGPQWAEHDLADAKVLIDQVLAIAGALDEPRCRSLDKVGSPRVSVSIERVLGEVRDPKPWRKKPVTAAQAARAAELARYLDRALRALVTSATACRERLALLAPTATAPKIDGETWLRQQLAALGSKEVQ